MPSFYYKTRQVKKRLQHIPHNFIQQKSGDENPPPQPVEKVDDQAGDEDEDLSPA
jgi:hypothetical protein